MRRRTLLAGMLALPAAATVRAATGGVAGPAVLLYDSGIAQDVARRARALGLSARATGGEIAALLHGTPLPALAGGRAVLGLTGYSEYMLAADIARRQGMAVRQVRRGRDGEAGLLLTGLLPAGTPGLFAWIATPRA